MRHIFAALSITALLVSASISPVAAQHDHDIHAAVGQQTVGQSQGPVRVEGAWARATPPGAKVGGAFVTLINTGDAADRFVSASSGIAERVELHTHIMDGDVMR